MTVEKVYESQHLKNMYAALFITGQIIKIGITLCKLQHLIVYLGSSV